MRNVLIIGSGGIGNRHLRGFGATGRCRLAIVEPDPSRRQAALRRYDIRQGWADVSEVDLTGFDLAVICAPAHVHVPIGRACADAGVPFLMEKPLSVSVAGVQELIEVTERQGLVARVGYIRRCGPEVMALRAGIRAGRIGTLRMASVQCGQHFPKYRPDFRETYYARPEQGGGAILDGASHMFDLLLWLLGPVREVVAFYACLELPTTAVEDSALISLRFADGCMGRVDINQFQQPNEFRFEVAGTKGNLRIDDACLQFADDDSGDWEREEFMDGMDLPAAHEARFAMQANLMLDALDGKPCLLTTLAEARDNLIVALAAKESYASGRIVKIESTPRADGPAQHTQGR